MNIDQITHRLSGTATWRLLAATAVAATVAFASSAPVAAAELDTVWPDHLVSRDGGEVADAYVWPDHLVTRDDGAVSMHVWPDHLVSRDGDEVADAYVWPDHLVAPDGPSRVTTAR